MVFCVYDFQLHKIPLPSRDKSVLDAVEISGEVSPRTITSAEEMERGILIFTLLSPIPTVKIEPLVNDFEVEYPTLLKF